MLTLKTEQIRQAKDSYNFLKKSIYRTPFIENAQSENILKSKGNEILEKVTYARIKIHSNILRFNTVKIKFRVIL